MKNIQLIVSNSSLVPDNWSPDTRFIDYQFSPQMQTSAQLPEQSSTSGLPKFQQNATESVIRAVMWRVEHSKGG